MGRFEQEITEIPEALRRLVAFYRGEGCARLDGWVARLAGRNRLLFSGMGTSEFSPLAIRPALAAIGITCETIDSGEWLHYPIPLPGEEGQVVLISQSGESVEIRALLELGLPGHDIVAITNDEESTLARAAALVFPLCAGEEAAITTKTFTNTLGVLLVMARSLTGAGGREQALASLDAVAAQLEVGEDGSLASIAQALVPCHALAFVGRGPAVAVARQGALTYMEGLRRPAAAFTGGAFRHGPFEAVGPGLGVVVLAPEGRSRDISVGLAQEAARLGAAVAVVTDADLGLGGGLHTVRIDNAPGDASEDLFPVAASGVLPRLLSAIGSEAGVALGEFRYGAKVTSRE
jgi:glucosamine--fructose-6-phosphate aminotransferase (isomerizing)